MSPAEAARRRQRDAESRVRRALLRRGVPAEEIDRAMAIGRIDLLAVEAVVRPGQARFTPAEVAERAGVRVDLVERLWRALGFALLPPEEGPAFSDADVGAFAIMRKLIERGLAEEEASVQLARVVGTTMARLAEAMVGVQTAVRPTAAERLAYAEDVLAPRGNTLDQVAKLLEFSWRHHMLAAARRGLDLQPGSDRQNMVTLTVGFADLVGYTALSQQLSEAALAAVVGRFEELAYEVVLAAGGRLIKTIGDEVMYVADDPAVAVRVALALAEAYADDDLLSEVRVGLATGPVLAKDGDYYGPVVNLASRLVTVAYPGTVVVSTDMHEALAGDPELAWRALRPRRLKDIGTMPLWAVYRPGEAKPPGSVRQRFRPLRTMVADASAQRAERRAVEAAVEAAIEAVVEAPVEAPAERPDQPTD